MDAKKVGKKSKVGKKHKRPKMTPSAIARRLALGGTKDKGPMNVYHQKKPCQVGIQAQGAFIPV